MKIACYRQQHELDGVSVLSLSTADVSVAEVLEYKFFDASLGSGEGEGDEAPVTPDSTGVQIPASPQRFRYRVGEAPGGEVVEAEGMILGSGDGSLLSFIEHRFVPDEASDRVVDRLLRQLQSGEISRSDWIQAMEKNVVGDQLESSYRRRRYDRDLAPPPSFIGYHRDVAHALSVMHDSRGRFFLRAGADEAPHAVVVPFEEQVDYEPIPRWRFATAGLYNEGVGGWDGRRYRVVSQYDELPETLRGALDRDGQAVIRARDWFVPLPDLKPEVVIRVPYASEVSDLVDAGPPPPWAAFQRPVFLVDTRRPVVLRGRPAMEVVVDPAQAVAMLARRTVRGAYVPDMPPAPVADLPLSPEGQPARYLAGCWIR